MNKTIYEEVLEIINRNTFELGLGFGKGLDVLSPIERTKIEKALEKAKKQEKLLELYKELSIIRDDLLSYCEVYDDDYDDFEYIETDLEKQIKELENEK